MHAPSTAGRWTSQTRRVIQRGERSQRGGGLTPAGEAALQHLRVARLWQRLDAGQLDAVVSRLPMRTERSRSPGGVDLQRTGRAPPRSGHFRFWRMNRWPRVVRLAA